MRLSAAFLVTVLGTGVVVAGCGARSVLDDIYFALPDAGIDASASDAATDGPNGDGASPTDAGRDVTPVPIGSLVPCGTENCFPQTEECCIPLTPGGHPACALKGKCTNGVGLSCTSSNQCPSGDACCLNLGGFGGGGGGGGAGATCQASCGGRGGGLGGGIQLCSSKQECPNGEQCQMTPFGVSVCGCTSNQQCPSGEQCQMTPLGFGLCGAGGGGGGTPVDAGGD